MTRNEGAGELVEVGACPIVPPGRGADGGSSVGDAAADDDVGAVAESFCDAKSTEVASVVSLR